MNPSSRVLLVLAATCSGGCDGPRGVWLVECAGALRLEVVIDDGHVPGPDDTVGQATTADGDVFDVYAGYGTHVREKDEQSVYLDLPDVDLELEGTVHDDSWNGWCGPRYGHFLEGLLEVAGGVVCQGCIQFDDGEPIEAEGLLTATRIE